LTGDDEEFDKNAEVSQEVLKKRAKNKELQENEVKKQAEIF
jgi:hypothetical protein